MDWQALKDFRREDAEFLEAHKFQCEREQEQIAAACCVPPGRLQKIKDEATDDAR